MISRLRSFFKSSVPSPTLDTAMNARSNVSNNVNSSTPSQQLHPITAAIHQTNPFGSNNQTAAATPTLDQMTTNQNFNNSFPNQVSAKMALPNMNPHSPNSQITNATPTLDLLTTGNQNFSNRLSNQGPHNMMPPQMNSNIDVPNRNFSSVQGQHPQNIYNGTIPQISSQTGPHTQNQSTYPNSNVQGYPQSHYPHKNASPSQSYLQYQCPNCANPNPINLDQNFNPNLNSTSVCPSNWILNPQRFEVSKANTFNNASQTILNLHQLETNCTRATSRNDPNAIFGDDPDFDFLWNRSGNLSSRANEPISSEPTTQIKTITMKKPTKEVTIIVLGVTGAGKSSLINFFYVWSKKIQRVQDIREVLINTLYFKGISKLNTEGNSANQNESQTQFSQVYEFQLESDDTIYNLQFMDTPGMGDVRGMQEDDKNIENILGTVAKTPELNAIVLMLFGSDPRVSDRLQYVVSKLVGIVPNVVKHNLIVLLSNSQVKPNLKVEGLVDDVPQSHIFSFDNLIFSIDYQTDSRLIQDANHAYELLKKKMLAFLELVSKMQIKMTREFKNLKEKREKFRNAIVVVESIIEDLSKKKAHVRDLIKQINEAQDKKTELDLKKLTSTTQTKDVQESTTYHNTICQVHKTNCHEQCGLQETVQVGDEIFKRCAAFAGSIDGKACNNCECDYTHHTHMRMLWKKETETIDVLDPNVQQQIMNIDDDMQKKRVLLDNLLKEQNKISREIEDQKDKILKLIKKMKEICSGFNYQKEVWLAISILQKRKELELSRNADPSQLEWIDKTIDSMETILSVVFTEKNDWDD